MKKPNLKKAASSIRNLVHSSTIAKANRISPIKKTMKKIRRGKALTSNDTEALIHILALVNIQERIDAGTYNVDEDVDLVEFNRELAFARIAIENI